MMAATAARPRFYTQLPESDRMKAFTEGQTVRTWPRTQNNAAEEKRSMDSIWSRKGATLSDKSARQEFGLT